MLPITLASSIVEISANGYYFNEVTGALSNSTIRLSALADASNDTTININVLTHLAKKRIRTLVDAGDSFADAKRQAETEVRSLFSFDDSNTTLFSFDQMDISQTGGSNAFLLMASSIFQKAYESSADLSEYIESLSQDLSDNGIVNNSILTNTISATELIIDLEVVRTNLEDKYSALGQSIVIPDFESLINRAPTGNAGTDVTSNVGEEVILNGEESYDIDNDTISFAWTLVSVPENSLATLTNPSSMTPSLIPDKLGTYSINLIVSDGEESSAVDNVLISTNNRPPQAVVEQELITTLPSQSITLDGSNSFDQDGEELTYLWSNDYSSTTYSEAISNTGIIPIPTPYRNIIFTLTVTDAEGLSSSAITEIAFTPIFTDNNNGTISDGLGHLWQQGDSNILFGDYFDDSKYRYCPELTLGGYDDWRLPALNELRLLVDTDFGSPTINTAFFPDTKAARYDTNTRVGMAECYYAVDFSNGEVSSPRGPGGCSDKYIRCIRDN